MTGASEVGGKADVYAKFGNPALLRLVREQLPVGGAVLDVGCASGGLLAALGGQANRREGIEPDPRAASAAAQVVDRVHVGLVGDVAGIELGAFDVVVLADVLEHVADPRTALVAATQWAKPSGRIVISLPNVAHWSIRLHLLRGHWDYQDRGILDDTHLRFFTWATGLRLVDSADLTVVDRRAVVPRLKHHVPIPVPELVERAWVKLGHRVPNLCAVQQLVVARPRRRRA